MTLDFTGHSFEETIILLNVKWYLSCLLRYRNLEEMMTDRGVDVDHTTIYCWGIYCWGIYCWGIYCWGIYCWGIKFSGSINKEVRRLKGPTAGRRKLVEMYIKAKGAWAYLYRAVDSDGDTIDFYLSKR